MLKDQSELEKLESDGWEKKFVACEPRLSEAVEAYKEAGFEVHLEPLPKEPEFAACVGEGKKTGDCRVCFEGVEDMFKTIYIRQTAGEIQSDDEIY